MTTKRFGFTLAEVLITLGIIGVVAAMTIPTLLANTNSAKFKSQYKKSVSTLNQAIQMGVAQYDMDIPGLEKATCSATDSPNNNDASLCALLNGTLTGSQYVLTSNLKTPQGNTYSVSSVSAGFPTVDTSYKLADGSIFAFKAGSLASCTLLPGSDVTGLDAGCKGYIDVNGTALPNQEVRCTGGTATESATVGDCVVRNNSADMKDVFPVVFHDQTVEPMTDAARFVLTSSK